MKIFENRKTENFDDQKGKIQGFQFFALNFLACVQPPPSLG